MICTTKFIRLKQYMDCSEECEFEKTGLKLYMDCGGECEFDKYVHPIELTCIILLWNFHSLNLMKTLV